MAAMGEGGSAAAEELRSQLAQKRIEADALRDQIRQMRLEAQSSRLRLQAVGVTDACLVPTDMKAGSAGPDLHHHEFRSLLEWLVDSVDLTRQVIFECGGEEVMVGGRRVHLKRMATWPVNLRSAGTSPGMQLSVPLDLQAEISSLIARSRAKGHVSEQDVQQLVDTWEMVGTEMASASTGRQEPAIFLVHAKLSQAVVVAKWPAMDLAPSRTFDPAQHFSRLAASPPAKREVASPAPERKSTKALVSSLPPPPTTPARQPPPPPQPNSWAVHAGDYVLVEYAGRWYSGILQDVDLATNVARVKCDVDEPGVITVAPLTSVFPIRIVPEEPPPAPKAPQEPAKPASRHMRSKTVG